MSLQVQWSLPDLDFTLVVTYTTNRRTLYDSDKRTRIHEHRQLLKTNYTGHSVECHTLVLYRRFVIYTRIIYPGTESLLL